VDGDRCRAQRPRLSLPHRTLRLDRPAALVEPADGPALAGLFYPEQWDGDLREETRAFYRLYYHVDLGAEELDRLLEWSEGKPPQ
jgi:iron complex transport system substrate-binding protein